MAAAVPAAAPAATAVHSPAVSDAAPLPPAPSPDAPKADWRRWARVTRQALALPERERRVVDGLLAWPGLAHAPTVLLYLAFGSEVGLASLANDPAHRVLVPRILERPVPRLTLHRLAGAELERHPLGPLQPRAGTPEVDPAEVDLALLPGLCFDERGVRLGYGRGYFDRFLARLRPEVPRVGVGYDALVVARLPRDAHDLPVTHLATESGVRAVRAGDGGARARLAR